MSGTVLLAYYMECTDLFRVHVQGFFCNDAELMKPYPGTEESSFVPPLILYCVVAAAPTAIVSKEKIHSTFSNECSNNQKAEISNPADLDSPVLQRVLSARVHLVL